jgi:Fur family transcriptional regulator, ferric uptake regulator
VAESRVGQRSAEELVEQLRANGYRLTPARQLVLGAVTRLEHATPDALCVEVQRTASSVNLSTVYRTLELLEDLGLVTHTHLGHGAPIYHAAAEQRHLHLVCRDCETVIETDIAIADPLVGQLREQFGFETDLAHFAVFGRCRDCLDRARPVEAGQVSHAPHAPHAPHASHAPHAPHA